MERTVHGYELGIQHLTTKISFERPRNIYKIMNVDGDEIK